MRNFPDALFSPVLAPHDGYDLIQQIECFSSASYISINAVPSQCMPLPFPMSPLQSTVDADLRSEAGLSITGQRIAQMTRALFVGFCTGYPQPGRVGAED